MNLQDWLSGKTGLVIEFKGISARLRLYGPELVFDDAIVRTPDRTRVLAAARRGSVAFDLWSSIRSLRLTAGRFTLDSPEIGLIRTRAGRIQLVGQNALRDTEAAKPVSIESLPVGQFHVRNAVVSFRDEMTGRGPWSVSGISFRLDRRTDLLQLQGEASLPQALGQSLEFSARVAGPLEDVDSLVSNFALEGHGLDLAGWADVLPDHWLAPETGSRFDRSGDCFHWRACRRDDGEAGSDGCRCRFAGVADATAAGSAAAGKSGRRCGRTRCCGDRAGGCRTRTRCRADHDPRDSVPELVGFDRLALTVNAARHDDAWIVSASNVDLSRKSSPWQADKIEVKWSPRPAGGSESRHRC